MLSFLQKLNEEGNTIVLITHDNGIAASAKRIVRIHDGKIIYDGPADAPGAVVNANVSFEDDPLVKKEKEKAQNSSFRKCRREGIALGVTQCFIMALKSLSTSKMRAFLTMLGIIIGVAAVILIMSLGNGMQVYINDMFAELGTTTINVSVMGRGSTRRVDVDDMYAFYEENADEFAQISPLVNVNASVRTTVDKETYTPTVTGVSEDYMDAKRQKLADGRNLAYIDIKENNKVCVVGAYYAYLYNDDIVGSYIKINGDKYTVVGVVEETDDRTDEDGGDNFVYVPYSTAAKFLAFNANISSYIFLFRIRGQCGMPASI